MGALVAFPVLTHLILTHQLQTHDLNPLWFLCLFWVILDFLFPQAGVLFPLYAIFGRHYLKRNTDKSSLLAPSLCLLYVTVDLAFF